MADERDYDDLVGRLSAGGGSIRPRPDAPAVLGRAIARDRLRRRTRVVVLSAAAAVVAVAATASLLVNLGGSDPSTPGPATASSDTPAPPVVDASRPAALFQQSAGGRARGGAIRYHLVPGERMNSQFEWWPEEAGGPGPYLAGVAIETYTDDDVACGAQCGTRAGGVRVASYEMALGDAFFDPLHRAARFAGDANPSAVVRGVTYYHPDGLAVSVFVCNCGVGGAASADTPPLTTDQLEVVASDDLWVARQPSG